MATNHLRINLTQFLLLGVLIALLVGVGSAAWRCRRYGLPLGVCVSPDAQRAAIWYDDGQLRVWEIDSTWPSGRRLDAVVSSAWSETDQVAFVDERTLAVFDDLDPATGAADPRIELWDLRDNRRTDVIRFDPLLSHHVHFLSEGRAVRISEPGDVQEFWDLRSGRQLRSLQLGEQMLPVQPTGDGSLLHGLDASQHRLVFLDAEHGQEVRSLDISKDAYAGHVSPDGRWAAILTINSPDAFDDGQFFLPTTTVELLEVDSGSVRSSVELQGYPSQLLFSPDGTRYLCVLDGHSSTLRAVTDGRIEGQLKDRSLLDRRYAFTPDGRQLIGVSDQAVTLWNAADGTRIRTLWRRGSTLNAFLFGSGFLLWAITWGMFSRRWRAESGESPSAGSSLAPLPPPPSSRRPPSLIRSLAFLGLITSSACFVFSLSLADSWPARMALTLGGGLGLLAVVFGLAVAYAVLNELGSKQYRAQLGRAVQVSGQQGRARQIGRFTTWFVGPSQLEPVLEEEIERAENACRELLGPCEFRWPGAILGFETHDQFQRYTGRRLPLAGVYYGWFRKQMVLCEAYGRQNLIEPRRTLRSLLAFHLALESKGFWLPPWVQAVVAAQLIGDDVDPQGLAAAQRRLRRDAQVAPRRMTEWLETSRKQLARAVLGQDELAAAHALTTTQDLSQSLAAFLFSDAQRCEQFRRFVRALSRKSDVAEVFREHFGIELPRLVERWHEWLMQQQVEFYPPPPDWLRREIRDHATARLRDPETSEQVKLRTAHYLGSAGYREALQVLVAARENGSPALRREATWAIEAILGREVAEDERIGLPVDVPQPAEAAGQEPLEAVLLPDPPEPEQPPVRPETAVPLVPHGLRQVRGFMFLGGVTALVLSHLMLFESGLWWLPTLYYGILVGVISVSRSVGRATRRLHVVSILQILNLVNCDGFNAALGGIELALLRGRAVREYLRFEGTPPEADG